MNEAVNMVSPTPASLVVPKEKVGIDAEVEEDGVLKVGIGENAFEEGVNQLPQLVSYEDIVADNDLFKETLLDLHKVFNAKLKIPKLGSRPLDLHKVFIEVTMRGGMKKVTVDRKWMEVARVVITSPFSSNVSTSLRKKYNTILYVYELIYFFRAGSLVVNDYRHIPTPNLIQKMHRPSRPSAYPKEYKTGYIYYFTEEFRKMKPVTFEMGQELARKIWQQWQHLSPSEKSVYLKLRHNKRR
ncbi:hypothetical protein ZOSMA_33G01220 [Zostera marina]|uniref:ARID domain-containing protein n=1 Tax=Zostera marina TaxID=29655 RepID=A0A0K9P7W0_ZOSMR|nr:hypothetical protein ZOSMA_33G01220 [Zostera marina]